MFSLPKISSGRFSKWVRLGGRRASKKRLWDEAKLRLAIDAAGVALWSWNVDDDTLTMDDRGYALWDVPLTDIVSFEDLSAPSIRQTGIGTRRVFCHTRARRSIRDRISHHDRVGRALDFRAWPRRRCWHGGQNYARHLLDVTGRKQAEEGHELLAGEMSHRVKNLLAIATGLTHITSRSTSTSAEMASELMQRLTALGRAHDLVRPIPGQEGKAALFGDLIAVLLAPYDDMGAFSGRVKVLGSPHGRWRKVRHDACARDP